MHVKTYICWECSEGQHENCANAALTDDDEIVDCACWEAEHQADRVQGSYVPDPCPECSAGKHQNCMGDTWDDVADEPTLCPCAEAGHG